MWGRKFLHGVEILGWFLIFVFIANRSALAKESVVYRVEISMRTTYTGGRYASGTVFARIPSNASWTETVLYGFTGGND
jgi:hypothetical protein